MMKRETKRRIAYYQDALPDMKKRVFAAALMLMIAVIVSITATYAWVTLSVAPVVSSVNTTMSANGALEIALSNPEGTEPEEFDIDESVTISTDDVTASNLRWGNLVNLSHTSYGIDNLVLRPAQLNTASLRNSPLWGAVYGADGRISTLDSNYTYTKWDGSDFMASREYGVRAIASYKAGASAGTTAEYNRMAEAVNVANRNVNNAYALVPGKMPAMSSMLSSFAQSKIDDAEKAFTSAELKSAYELYKTVYDAMLLECDAMVALANFQSYVAAQNDLNMTYVPLTWDDLVAGKANYNAASTTAKSKNGIVSITGLTQFITDLGLAKTDVECLEKYYKGAGDGTMTIYWSTGGDANHQVGNIVSNLLDYGTMSMVLDGEEYKLVSLSMDMATKMLGLSGKHTNVYIYGGIMKRFEQLAIDESTRLQGQTNKAVATVKVTYMISITVYGDCYTKASGSSYFASNYAAALGNKLVGSDVMAEDTYGMAVDFWLRTNAEETYLTLEGAMTADDEQNIMKYDGVNRVWGSTGNANLTTNSTTQGGGSCYIYYADTPEDMMRSLELLRSMKVAFVDKSGNMLALASMDTENYYAVNGRITVPLAVEETSGVSYTYIDEDQSEKTGRAVTLMTHDESLWVTAIIYLDGAHLGNDDVLSAADIDGQLNIQFGSSVDLNTVGDNKLLTAERSVSADADPKLLDWATARVDADLTTNVTVTVDGTEPDTVTAFFVRAINSTQGERQEEMTFTESATKGQWTSSYKFDAPGVYYLRYVRLDGVDYALADPVMVEVEGFAISEVTWGESGKQSTIYTPESYYETTVSAKITSNDSGKIPKTVQARFLRDDGIMVNVDMRYDPSGTWSGTGTFYRSGTYELQYMLLDGEYYDVTDREYELTLYLGLSVAVYNNGSSLQDEYLAENTYNKSVGVIITDNDGNILPTYEEDAAGNRVMLDWTNNVRLRYSPGSSVVNSVETPLTWAETGEWFIGTLPIVNPGRYTFYDVTIGNNSLTRATESPVYTIMPPDPPRYQTSQSPELQFAPLTNDGYIGPISITDSQTAALVAEVYNSVSKQTYLIPNSAALDTYLDEDEDFVLSEANGLMTYDSVRDSWVITPKYTSGGAETQEGVWTVKNIYVWNFIGDDGTLFEYDRHEVWSENQYNFSGLETEISCSLKVTMDPGDTTLGDSSTPFMTKYYVKDIGIKVTMTDDAGRAITGSVLDKMKVNLGVSYAKNTDLSYGYEVTSGAAASYTIPFTYNSSEAAWVVDTSQSDYAWQYVGEYTVSGLTVMVGNHTLSADKVAGVPKMYTVTSDSPDANNLSIEGFSQNATEFGKTDGVVTGTFLESHNPSVVATTKLTYVDTAGETKKADYARISGTKMILNLDYQDGNSAPNGGYTWTGSSSYTAIKLSMTNTDTGTTEYSSGTTPLLAGTYKLSITLMIGDDEGNPITSYTNADGVTKTLQDIEVYSMKPSLTVSEYKESENESYALKNSSAATSYSNSNYAYGFNQKKKTSQLTSANGVIEVANEYDDVNNVCTVYIPLTQAEEEGYYALFFNDSGKTVGSILGNDYDPRPTIKLKLSGLNTAHTYGDISVSLTGNNSNEMTVEWMLYKDGAFVEESKAIGEVSGYNQYSQGWCSSDYHYYINRKVFGTATVEEIEVPLGDCTYTVELQKALTINNPY